mgnify:CR=1 FL=1
MSGRKIKDMGDNTNINIKIRYSKAVFEKLNIDPQTSYLKDVKKAIFKLYGIPNPDMSRLSNPHKTLAEQKPNNAYGVWISWDEIRKFMHLFGLTENDRFQEGIGSGRIVNDILNKEIDVKEMSFVKADDGAASDLPTKDTDESKKLLEFEQKHTEGAERKYIQTIRERNPKLRKAAIGKYGRTCMVCKFNFDDYYAKEFANSYIEVHHTKLLSDAMGEIETDIKDVIVVCSNCHRVIHRKRSALLDWVSLRRSLESKEKRAK